MGESTWEERMAATHRDTTYDVWNDEVLRRNGEEFTYEKAVQDALDYCSKCAEPKYEEFANRWQAFTTCKLGEGGCEFECEHHKDEIWLA